MSFRNVTIIILVIIIALAIAAGVYFWLAAKPEPAAVEQPAAGGLNLPKAPGKAVDFSALNPEEREREMSKADLERLASFFAERYGTYSSQNNFHNLRDLEIYMTENMKLAASRFIAQQKEEAGEAAFYGVATKSLVNKVIEFDKEGASRVQVSTQREESRGNPLNSNLYYQDLILTFKKAGLKWLVEGAAWQ